MKMILASHNSFTYLLPRTWWLKSFAIFAKCQSLDYQQQYAVGVRWFDIRLRFDKAGNPVICHGLMEYKFPQGESLELAFAWLAEQSERVQVSMKLEERTDDGNDTQEWLMRSFASRVIAKYGDRLLFENICRMRDWSILFPVASELLNYSTYVDFGSAPINSRNKWWSQCCPWLYAKVYNAKHCVDSAKYDMRMMDFVTYTL